TVFNSRSVVIAGSLVDRRLLGAARLPAGIDKHPAHSYPAGNVSSRTFGEYTSSYLFAARRRSVLHRSETEVRRRPVLSTSHTRRGEQQRREGNHQGGREQGRRRYRHGLTRAQR